MSANELKPVSDDPFLQGDQVKKLESDPFLIQKPEGNQLKYLYLEGSHPREDDTDVNSPQIEKTVIKNNDDSLDTIKIQKPHVSKSDLDYSPYIPKVTGNGVREDSQSIVGGLVFVILLALSILYISTLINKGKKRGFCKTNVKSDLMLEEAKNFVKKELSIDENKKDCSKDSKKILEVKNRIFKEAESLICMDEVKKEYIDEISPTRLIECSEEDIQNLDRNLTLLHYPRLETLAETIQDVYKLVQKRLFSSECTRDYFWYTGTIKNELILQLLTFRGDDPKEIIKNMVIVKIREVIVANDIKGIVLPQIIDDYLENNRV